PLMVQVAIMIPIMVGLDVKRKSGIVIGLIYFVIYLLTSYAAKKAYVISGLGYKSISKLTLYIGLASGAICGLLYNTEFWVLALLFFIVIYIVENIRLPILTGDLADQVPDEILTSVISAKSFLATLMTTALVLLLGVLSDHFGIGISLVAISCFLVLFTLVVGKLKIYSV
ncbi:MAG: hypothetical protein KDC34_14835, partial [Saprospiraceae bacterium]|nr:hypothetical protein [Saprospiraceae bacterium]